MIFSSMISRSSCGTASVSDRSVDMISNIKFFTFLLCSSLNISHTFTQIVLPNHATHGRLNFERRKKRERRRGKKEE